jgi:ubiquinone/menaquinone biosynthesis C-methylase UbiE
MFDADGPTFLELARQALSSTVRGYDLLAPKFDATPFRTPDSILEVSARHFGEPERAIDVCCGTGAAIPFLRARSLQVVGLDFSDGMLAEARRRAAAAPGAPVAFLRADAREMPFDGCFQLATCFGALGHFVGDDEEHLVAAIARALAPGGRFVFVSAYAPPAGSLRWIFARGFNAAMHVRNALWRPPFIMYYLTFLLPDVEKMLARHGFDTAVETGPFPPPFGAARLVIATKRR